LRHNEAVLDVVGGEAFESRLAAVCVDEVAEGGERQPSIGKPSTLFLKKFFEPLLKCNLFMNI
jgi:hypothetical protein